MNATASIHPKTRAVPPRGLPARMSLRVRLHTDPDLVEDGPSRVLPAAMGMARMRSTMSPTAANANATPEESE